MVALYLALSFFWSAASLRLAACIAAAIFLPSAVAFFSAFSLAAISFLYLARRAADAFFAAPDSLAIFACTACILAWKAACAFMAAFSATIALCMATREEALSSKKTCAGV